jgi:hypothetical protein
MAVWVTLQCILCEEFTLFDAEFAIEAGSAGTPANDRQDNMLRTRERAHVLNHGGVID